MYGNWFGQNFFIHTRVLFNYDFNRVQLLGCMFDTRLMSSFIYLFICFYFLDSFLPLLHVLIWLISSFVEFVKHFSHAFNDNCFSFNLELVPKYFGVGGIGFGNMVKINFCASILLLQEINLNGLIFFLVFLSKLLIYFLAGVGMSFYHWN